MAPTAGADVVIVGAPPSTATTTATTTTATTTATAAATTTAGKPSRPNKDAHEAAVQAIQADINAFAAEQKVCKEGMDRITAAHNDKRGEIDAAKAALAALMAEKKELMDVRATIVASRDAAQAAVNEQLEAQKKLREDVPYSSADEIDRKIKELELKQSTTSMTLAVEKLLVADIKKLVLAKKALQAVQGMRDSIDKQKAVQKAKDGEYGKNMAVIKAVGDRINKQREVLDGLLKGVSKGGDSYPKLKQRMNELRDKVNKKYQELKDLKTAFKKEEDRYYKSLKEEREKEKEEREKEWAAKREEREALRKEQEAEELLKPPYQEELALCDFLSAYLRGIQRATADDEQEPDATANDTKMLNGLPGMKVLRNNLDDYTFGPGKKARGKKRGGGNGAADKIKMGIDTLEFFASLALTPPTCQGDIGASLEALEAKKTYFSTLERGAIRSIGDMRREKGREHEEKTGAATARARPTDEVAGKPKAVDKNDGTNSLGKGGNSSTPKTKGKPAGKMFSLDDDFPSLGTGSAAVQSKESITVTEKSGQ